MISSATSYDVTIYKTTVVNGERGKAYRVRWAVAGNRRSDTFRTTKLADSFRANLVSAARKGEAFDVETGKPISMRSCDGGPTWLEFAMEFVDMKWSDSSPRHRHSTADGLVRITTAMADTTEEPPDAAGLREALKTWAFNTSARKARPEPPEEFVAAMTWITKHGRPLSDLNDPVVLRRVLDEMGRRLDGRRAAPTTANVKRAALTSAISYAIERGHLDSNPLARVKVKRRATADAVDSRVVVNHRQGRALLDAIRAENAALEAFFGCVYYAAMRPGEVRNLRAADLELPASGWGRAVLHGSYQDSGKAWTDDGKLGEERSLKHRVRAATREVPLAPPLVTLLRGHLAEFGTACGWLFVTRQHPLGRPLSGQLARPVPLSTVNRTLKAARAKALTEAEQNSPLVRRTYDLRHAAVSTWLAAGVAPTQVANWAGHSVAVLLKVYAHAIDGQAETARRRIEEALAAADEAVPDSGTAQAQIDVDDR